MCVRVCVFYDVLAFVVVVQRDFKKRLTVSASTCFEKKLTICYHYVSVIGHGSFGVVCHAKLAVGMPTVANTAAANAKASIENEDVAIKKVFQDRGYQVRNEGSHKQQACLVIIQSSSRIVSWPS